MTWRELFSRAEASTATEAAVRTTLDRRRVAGGRVTNGSADPDGARDGAGDGDGATGDPITRVVADADVLAADLLVGGPSREALDLVRAHSWVTLVASDPLLSEAEAVVAELADAALAADWRAKVEGIVARVEHPPDDHPAIASAYRGDARHVLSLDESLLSAGAGASIRGRVETSVKHPEAFVRLFDPATIHPVVAGSEYPGPDVDPRD